MIKEWSDGVARIHLMWCFFNRRSKRRGAKASGEDAARETDYPKI